MRARHAFPLSKILAMLGNVSDLKGMDAALQSWLVGYQPRAVPALRLICLAHAGGHFFLEQHADAVLALTADERGDPTP
jgi:hypothetical protein